MAKEFKLTAARVKELEEELNYLKTTPDAGGSRGY